MKPTPAGTSNAPVDIDDGIIRWGGVVPRQVRRREALRWIETMAHSRASEQTRASFRFVAA
jgi:hypothetical protein